MRKNQSETEWKTGIPKEGDDVLVPCNITLIIDLAEISVNSITIDGIVKFDESLPEI